MMRESSSNGGVVYPAVWGSRAATFWDVLLAHAPVRDSALDVRGVRSAGGLEYDQGYVANASLLIRRVASVRLDDLRPQLGPFCLTPDTSAHWARVAGNRDPDIRIVPQVEEPLWVPVIATVGGDKNDPAFVDDGRRQDRRALLSGPAPSSLEDDYGHAPQLAEQPALRHPKDRPVDACPAFEELVL